LTIVIIRSRTRLRRARARDGLIRLARGNGSAIDARLNFRLLIYVNPA
jgi:hypothetical protein